MRNAVVGMMFVFWAGISAGQELNPRCVAAMDKAVGGYGSCLLRVEARSVRKANPKKIHHLLDRCEQRFNGRVAFARRIYGADDCTPPSLIDGIAKQTRTFVENVSLETPVRTEWTLNHTRDQDIEKVFRANDVIFKWTRGTESNEKSFGEDIVHVGTTADGQIIEFACPEISPSFQGKTIYIEVSIEEVAGTLNSSDPVISLKNVAFEFWGDFPTETDIITLTEDEAAKAPVLTEKGGSILNIPLNPAATPDPTVLYPFKVSGTIGKAKGLNEKQTEALKFVNALFTGLAMEGTSVSWEIDLEHSTEP